MKSEFETRINKTVTPSDALLLWLTRHVVSVYCRSRVKGNQVTKIFNYTNKEPKVPRTYDYYKLAIEEAQEIFPDIWLKEIRAAIDKG